MRIEVTDGLVAHIAQLSRLDLSQEQAAELKEHFEKVLAYVESFQDLDTADVDPSHFSGGAVNVFRSDEVRPSLPVEQGLANAPSVHESKFVVPRIIDAAADADDQGGGA